MKSTIINPLPILVGAALLISAPLRADLIVWDSTKIGGSWTNSSMWMGGFAPSATDNVSIQGPFTGQTADATISNIGSFQSLGINLTTATAKNVFFDIASASSVTGSSINLQSNAAAGAAFFRITAGSQLTLTGDVIVGTGGASGTTGIAGLSLTGGATLAFQNLYLQGKNDSVSRLNLTASSSSTVNTINGNIYIQSGGNVNDNSTSAGKNHFTGNIAVAGGNYSVGRSGDNSPVTHQVDGAITLSAGTLLVHENAKLQAGSLTQSGGTFSFRNVASSPGVATVVVDGDFNLEGGTLQANLTDALGALEVKGTWSLRNAPTLNIGSGQFAVKLAGDLRVESTTLGGSTTFNTLDLTLTGSTVQKLEAASTTANGERFRLNSLTLSGTEVELTNLFNQGGAGNEFFWTGTLINSNESTLLLNGLEFYYGLEKTLLTPGIYHEFGGTLNVVAVPEPSWGLISMGGAAIVLLVRRRRGNRVAKC